MSLDQMAPIRRDHVMVGNQVRCCSRRSREVGTTVWYGRSMAEEHRLIDAIASFLLVVTLFLQVQATGSCCDGALEQVSGHVTVRSGFGGDAAQWRRRSIDSSNLANNAGDLGRDRDRESGSSSLVSLDRRTVEKSGVDTIKKTTKKMNTVDDDGGDRQSDDDVHVDVSDFPISESADRWLRGLGDVYVTAAPPAVLGGKIEADAEKAERAKLSVLPMVVVAMADIMEGHVRDQRSANANMPADASAVTSLSDTSSRRILETSTLDTSPAPASSTSSFYSSPSFSTAIDGMRGSNNINASAPSLFHTSANSAPTATFHVPDISADPSITEFCNRLGGQSGKCIVSKTPTGYLIEIFSPKYATQSECSSFLLVPAENTWRREVKVVLFLLGILYIFVGLICITAVFMRAMEVIVNQKCVVLQKHPLTGHLEKHVGRLWNNTVADITLLAFGTSAPQISLALIDAIQTLGQPPGGLGVGTIIGSAAFNVFPILAVCVLVPKSGSFKKIQNFGVWVVELTWSIWAYVWLIIILQVWTPDVITVTEAVMTVLQFPILIVHAYSQDKGWWPRFIQKWKARRIFSRKQIDEVVDALTPVHDEDGFGHHPPMSRVDDSDLREGEEDNVIDCGMCADRRLSWSSPSHHKYLPSRRSSVLNDGLHIPHIEGYITHSGKMGPCTDPFAEHTAHHPRTSLSGPLTLESSSHDTCKHVLESCERGHSCTLGNHAVHFQEPHRPHASATEQSLAPLIPAVSIDEPLSWEDVKNLWSDQFRDAMTVKVSTSGDGGTVETEDPSFIDFVLHVICFFWKILFAFIPPPEIWHGRLAFASAVGWITAMSYVLIDLANLFGCVSGMNSFVLAITILATGTCLPDLIASYIATQNDATADSAIANINASNCINVFVGIGLPWLVNSLYNRFVLNQQFSVPSNGIWFSVLIFCIATGSATAIMLSRRYLLGGELGGPRRLAVISSIVFLLHWVFYIALSSLKAYNSI